MYSYSYMYATLVNLRGACCCRRKTDERVGVHDGEAGSAPGLGVGSFDVVCGYCCCCAKVLAGRKVDVEMEVVCLDGACLFFVVSPLG